MDEVDHKFRKLAETLKADIMSGKYTTERPLPSVRALMKRLGLSSSTVRQAVADLEREGLVSCRRGAGTFVTRQAAARKIGLVIPGVAYSEFFPVIVGEISRLALSEKYTLVFCDVMSKSPEKRATQVLRFVAELVRQNVSGVIFHPIECVRNATRLNKKVVSMLDAAGIPVVLLDNDILPPPDRSAYDVVGVNNFAAGQTLATHLIACGAKRIHCMMYDFAAGSVKNRFSGVKFCVGEVKGVETGFLCADPADATTVRAYVRKHRPDAFVCGNDTVAAILGQTMRKIGVRVPEDVLLAGFDDLQHAVVMTPQLTTIHQPCEALSRLAFHTLLERMRNPKMDPREIFLPARLVIRESTRKFLKKPGGRP